MVAHDRPHGHDLVLVLDHRGLCLSLFLDHYHYLYHRGLCLFLYHLAFFVDMIPVPMYVNDPSQQEA